MSSYVFLFVNFQLFLRFGKRQLPYVHYYINHFVGFHIRTVLSQFTRRKQPQISELIFTRGLVNSLHHVEHLLSLDTLNQISQTTDSAVVIIWCL